jgi:hypothetical protein
LDFRRNSFADSDFGHFIIPHDGHLGHSEACRETGSGLGLVSRVRTGCV